VATPSAAVTACLQASLVDAGHRVEQFAAAMPQADLVLVDTRCLGDPNNPFNGDLGQAVVFGFGASAYAGTAGEVVDGPLTSRKIAGILGGTLAPESRATSQTRRGHVLLVEDNRVNQQVAAGLLAKIGLTVEIAGDGKEAVERVSAKSFDLVLMDMQMPVMDGLEATRQIRALASPAAKVPIVGLTSNAFVSDRQVCLNAGMDGFVAKPVNLRKLDAVLGQWLGVDTADAVAASGGASASDHGGETPESDHADAGKLIDAGQQALLRDELGEEAFAALVRSFWNDAAAILGELQRTDIEPTVARRALHTLKGTALTIGFAEIAEVAARMQAGLDNSGRFEMAALQRSITRTKDLSDPASAHPGDVRTPRHAA
jgi:CheY-like chemotaxis protein